MRKNRMLTMFTALGLTAVVAAAIAAPASAVGACSYSSATGKVSLALAGYADVATIRRSGDAIQVNGFNCGAATVFNTDLIRVDGTPDSSQQVTVDLGGGAFEPGLTPEGTGTSEIEFEIDLGSGSNEKINVTGGAGADNVVFGTGGAKLNSDGDADLQYAGLDSISLTGNGGADTLSIGADPATGSPLNVTSDINGGDGADTLTGGRVADTIQGGTDVSNDVIHGGTGNDPLKGGPGDDQLYGEAGYDYLDGDLGNDSLFGGQESDFLNYYGGASADGADVISGGPSNNDSLYLANRTGDTIVTLDGRANDGADTNADGVADEGDNIEPDVEQIQTGGGNDVIDARSTNARAVGHYFASNAGNDKVYGGDEQDSLTVGQGNDTVDGGDSGDSIDASAGNDVVTGGDGGDMLYPWDDDDTVNGSGGDDYLDAGGETAGADSLSGGPGFDRVSYTNRSTNLYLVEDNHANDGTDADGTVGGEEGDNLRTDVEQIDGGKADDLINLATSQANVQAADNVVNGGTGNDTIKSGLGVDYADGGDGADRITGGAGEDTAYGRNGADVFTMNDGFYDYVDGGSGDGVNDSGTFDSIDQKVNFP
jgi:Ca2+-binding RTX toxin-like protein